MVSGLPGEGGRPASGDVRAGFTLAEALVALTISSVLVVLVSSVFLAQNRYYALQVERSGAQDVVRAITELVAAEVRSSAAGGFGGAHADSVMVRSPMVIGAICATGGGYAYVQMEGGGEALDEDELAGVAVYLPGTESWTFHARPWVVFDGGTQDAADQCAANGADTVGVYDDFHRIRRLPEVHGSMPAVGTPLMFYRQTTFSFRPSLLDTSSVGFFYRSAWSATATEYATGLDTTSGFQYRRVDQSGLFDNVYSTDRDSIDAVRIVAEARRRPSAGGTEDVTFGWSVTVPVRNVR